MAGEKRGVQDLRGWYWSDFKPAKKQRQSRIDAVFLLVWKFGGCIRLKVASLGRKWLGKSVGARLQTSKKTTSIQDWCCFFAGLKIWRLYKAKSSFFRQEMAGEKRGVQDLRGWYWSDFKPAKKQRQSRIDAVFLLVWKFGGCIRLKVASLGRKWLGKSVGCKIWGADTDQISNQQKTTSIQDWCCFLLVWKFGGCIRLKVASLGRKWRGKSVGCKIWGADTDQISNQAKKQRQSRIDAVFCWFENLEAV